MDPAGSLLVIEPSGRFRNCCDNKSEGAVAGTTPPAIRVGATSPSILYCICPFEVVELLIVGLVIRPFIHPEADFGIRTVALILVWASKGMLW